jgi:hypothetical protein
MSFQIPTFEADETLNKKLVFQPKNVQNSLWQSNILKKIQIFPGRTPNPLLQREGKGLSGREVEGRGNEGG